MQRRWINTCIDTSGFGIGRYEEILELTDLVLMDIKHYSREGYIKVTGRQPDEAEKFLKAVQDSGTPMWIRHVVVPGAGPMGTSILKAWSNTSRPLKG